jgi:hypothetical protein
MTLKQPLVPVDGSIFHGSLRRMPNGELRATCATRIGVASGTKEVEPQNRSFDTADEAREWVQSVGLARGFKSMVWDD